MTQSGRLLVGIGIVLIIAISAAGGGYWAGKRMAMDRIAASQTPASKPTKKEPKLLYYRNPMGLSDTSPTPKKDPMGMDYIPVYADEQDTESAAANQIKISSEKVQKLGVRTEMARMRSLDRIIRASGRIEADERRIYAIAPKFEGYIETLYVNITGQPVHKGQPLFEFYSPELVSAQREYAIATQGIDALKEAGGEAQASMRQLTEASLARLKNWDISAEQVKALTQSEQIKHTLTFRSPVNGIVTEKKALQGMRFMPGETLYQITDLSAVWIIADVFEQDIGLMTSGARAKIRINAYPNRSFAGVITYVYPTLTAQTRTVPVRIESANPGALLKPGMFAQVELPIKGPGPVVTVPLSAVIDSGTRQIALIQAGEGRYEPREVKLGARSDTYVEIVDGIKNGESVVVSANFLIDAESNLRAAVNSFGPAGHGGGNGAPDEASGKSNAAQDTGHRAEGTVDTIEPKTRMVSISHGPVESLNWPAMTMGFKVANSALLEDLKPGAAISFVFVEQGPGEWVITSIHKMTKTHHSHASH